MAQGENGILDGGQNLSMIEQQNPYLGQLLRRMINAVNTSAANANVSPIGNVSPPPPIDSVSISGALSNGALTVNGEILHLTVTHNQAVNKGVRYFTEIDTSPHFTQPHVIDHGTSRSLFVHLPANNAANQPITYYARSYAQYQGSDPTEPCVYGGRGSAIPIMMTGTSKISLLSSSGSGTAQTTGQQGGKGLGTVQTRPVPGPKRNIQ